MDLHPSSITNRYSNHSHLSEIVPTKVETRGKANTKVISNNSLDNWKRIENTRRIGKAWRRIGNVLENALETSSRGKWGQEMLDPCLVKSTKASCWYFFYILVILLFSVLFTVPAVLIPQQNVMEYPTYWWDLMIPASVGYSLYVALNSQLECKVIFRFNFLLTFKLFLRLYAVSALGGLIPFCVSHLVWTVWLGNAHPVPFLGLVAWVINFVHFVHLWFEFPSELRMEPGVRKRIQFYFLYRLWFLFYGLEKLALGIMFEKIPIKIQWIMAIIFPLARELNLWILTKLLEKATNYELTIGLVPKLTALIAVNIVHAFFVAMILGNSSTKVTSYAILAVEVILNLYSSYQIIKLHRKTVSKDLLETEKIMTEKKEETLQLFAVETVEYLVPLVYTITFLMAFYGPNATILGNIRNSDWQYQEVEDVEHFIGELMKMFFVDLASLAVSGTIFWKVCSANFLQEGYQMVKLYWPLISVKIGGKIFQVLC